jgi:hypothetical protein
MHEYDPDYVVPTATVLREWLESNGMLRHPSVAAVRAAGRDTAKLAAATAILEAVLNDEPFTENTAVVLELCTDISVAFWEAFEHNYRTGLAAGKVVVR